MTIRVLIVDDQALVRAGFRMMLDAAPGIEVVGEAADGTAAVRETARMTPDVVLMDIRMPAMDGITATEHIRAQDNPSRVLIVTTYDLDEFVFRALRAGASGFILKDTQPEELVEAVRIVASGDGLCSPSVTRRLIEEFGRRPGPSTSPELGFLTPRELDVLKGIGQGLNNREIASHLFLGEATIKTYVNRIFAKLGLRDRAQAVVFAYEAGVVDVRAQSPRPVA
ncbi:MAG: response regulator transcription factor [Acidimicrobiales bacterium]